MFAFYGYSCSVPSSCINGVLECSDHGKDARSYLAHGTGECHAVGDPHYISFDGAYFDFQGDCSYILAQDSSVNHTFDVIASNVMCGSSGVTCTKDVEIVLQQSINIRLLRGRHVVLARTIHMCKRKCVNEPPTATYNYTVTYNYGTSTHNISTYNYTATYKYGTRNHNTATHNNGNRNHDTAIYNYGTRVRIILDPMHKGSVTGLCGNYDGIGTNDFTSASGVVETIPQLFANSWKMSSSCADVINETHSCESAGSARASWAYRSCNFIYNDIFEDCVAALGDILVQQYHSNCIYDACGQDCHLRFVPKIVLYRYKIVT
ncbi:PREDICTED: mucin-2-like [Priapulus caudatus]|uniref:Mucin-2-like n=1 Tax=Priapulus caudatus TaxID=37621 RepID=A0ABM1E8X6_PRICU|nr:PREDICTED: mucin-2-like [Priapulus caudatus]